MDIGGISNQPCIFMPLTKLLITKSFSLKMKRNNFLLFTTGALMLLAACSKTEMLEESALAAPPTTMATNSSNSSKFFYGVNGHPLGTVPYTSVSAKTQINLLKSMGMNIYRIDVMSRLDNGYITVPHLYKPLKEAADAAGVTLLPMLYPRDFDIHLSESKAYQRGRTLGDRFARRYANDFTYYNLGNELDLKCLLSPSLSGASSSHYDMKRFKTVAAYLKGMNDGIKSKDPDAKTIINANWMHFEYLLMLERFGVKFDIVGYHWYDEMERLALKNHKISDITTFLSSKFKKPIWFLEVGMRNSSGTRTEAEQKAFFDSFLAKCRKNPQVKAAIIYQLYDEPQKGSGLEANYGIFKWAKQYTQFVAKSFAK